MLEQMTAEQFDDWIQFAGKFPFGEDRADMRQAAGVMWQLAPYSQGDELPSLTYPYFAPEEDLDDRIKRLDAEAKKWQPPSHGSQSTLPQT